jgi:hypothetical protein
MSPYVLDCVLSVRDQLKALAQAQHHLPVLTYISKEGVREGGGGGDPDSEITLQI